MSVFGSAEVPVAPSAREREAQNGEALLRGFWREGSAPFADLREMARPIPIPAAAAAAAAAIAEGKGDEAALGLWGGLRG